jgi:hypothetical protein
MLRKRTNLHLRRIRKVVLHKFDLQIKLTRKILMFAPPSIWFAMATRLLKVLALLI